MKTAISLPDELFREIDTRARQLKLSRSGLLAQASREFLQRHGGPSQDPTDAWNRAIDGGGQPGEESGAVAAQRRTREIVRASVARKKR